MASPDSISRLAALQTSSSSGLATAALKSPTKSPAAAGLLPQHHHAAASAGERASSDDSARASDQQELQHSSAAATQATTRGDSAARSPAQDAAAGGPGSAPASERHLKYMQLLSVAYSPSGPATGSSGSGNRSRPGSATGTPSPSPPPLRTTPHHEQPHQQQPPHTPSSIAQQPAADVPPLRGSASPKSTGGRAASSTPVGPGRRSIRSSILDSSQSGSLIPSSPGYAGAASSGKLELQHTPPPRAGGGSRAAAAAPSPSPIAGGSRILRSSAGSAVSRAGAAAAAGGGREQGSPMRRPAQAAAASRQQGQGSYAFGSRIEAAAAASPAALQRRPSPARLPSRTTSGSASLLNAAAERANRTRAAASPQRMPPGARASAPAAGAAAAAYRSTSAPRMSSAEKAQSRFTQHVVSAAAAQRSRTPNPMQRTAAAPAAGSSAAAAAARRRPQAAAGTGTSAESRHIARMQRASADAAGPHSPAKTLGGGGAFGRPASPMARAAARSLPAAAAPAGSRILPTAPAGLSAKPGPRSERLAMAAAASSSTSSSSTFVLPVIKDRYKSLYKHTPASLAVEEARAAAGAGTAGATRPRSAAAAAPVPRLALAGMPLVGPSGAALLAPRGEQQQQGGVALAATHGSQEPRVPSLSPPQLQQMPRRAPSPSTPQALAAPGAAAGFSNIGFTPPKREGPDETPSLLVKQASRVSSTGGSSKAGSQQHQAAAEQQQQQPGSPPLAPRNLMGASGMDAGESSSSGVHAAQPQAPLAAEPPRAGVAAAAKGLVVPPLFDKLPGGRGLHHAHTPAALDGDAAESPPRRRRGGPDDGPEGNAAAAEGVSRLQQQPLKSKASSVCSTKAAAASVSSSKAGSASAAGGKTRPRLASGHAAPAPGGSKQEQQPLRRSLGSLPQAPTASSGPSVLATPPAAGLRRLSTPGPAGSTDKGGVGLPSPSKRLGTPVPRLDLTPVFTNMEAEEEAAAVEAAAQHGLLLLEDAAQPPLRMQDLDAAAEDEDGALDEFMCGVSASKAAAAKGHASDGKRSAGSGGKGSGGKKAGGAGSKGAAPQEEAPQEESFYVYESVMPAEEVRSYEELRRVLQRTPGAARHAANLQALWGCYQDARRNTEAMAFRGHRLLDQVSTEYGSFKKDAEVKMEELEAERDAAREEAQLAMVAGSVPATALQLAQKDKQVVELQGEVALLRQQLVEMEKALQMASDYHSATQAAQVPMHARVIAGSATTNILTNLTLEQQARLQASEKQLEDMKAALHLVCGVLRQSNYAEARGGLRDTLDSDTLCVLDTIMATEEMEGALAEAVAAQQQQQQQQQQMGLQLQQEGSYGAGPGVEAAACGGVHIEEVVEEQLAAAAAAEHQASYEA